MRASIIILALLLFSITQGDGQTRTVIGRVIDADDLLPIPSVRIQTTGKLLLGETDTAGRFKIDLPEKTQTLLFGWIGYEMANIKLNNNCDTVDVVMMASGSYDFMSPVKIDKERLKRFNKLPDLYLQAYKKGLFTKGSPCYTREFHPEKSELDSIGKEMAKIWKETKSTFKRLNIGDTVRIPFSDHGGYRADGTDRTTLIEYTSYTGGHGHHSGCIITCIVTGKNRHRRAYNIVCKVINCSGCKDPSVFDGKVMRSGVVFTYNMRYGVILGTQNFQ